MSRALLWGVLAAGLLTSAPTGARAQATEAELVRELESLREPLAEAREAADEARERWEAARAAANRAPLDTIRVGLLTVVTFPDQADLAREIFGEVWREHFSNVSESAWLEGAVFTFQWRARPMSLYVAPRAAGGPPVVRVEPIRFAAPTRARVQAIAANAIANTLILGLPAQSPLRRWLAPLNSSRPNPESVYRSIAAAPLPTNPPCLEGNVEACRVMLGIWGEGGTPSAWLEPAAQGWLVRNGHPSGFEQAERDDPAVGRCVRQDDYDACGQVLDGLVWAKPSWRVGGARTDLVWHAVRRGGPGAWSRLVERIDADPAAALAHASGLTEDELVASWQAELLEHRPEVYAGLSTTRWAVLFWFLFFAALAMRSTRWRLG